MQSAASCIHNALLGMLPILKACQAKGSYYIPVSQAIKQKMIGRPTRCMSPASWLNANNGSEARSIVLRNISHALEIDKAHGNLHTCCKAQIVKRSKYKLKVPLLRLLDRAKNTPRGSLP